MNQHEQLFSKTSKTNENEHSCIFIPGQHLFSSSELQDVCWFSTKIQQGPPDLTSKYSFNHERRVFEVYFFIFETVGRKEFFCHLLIMKMMFMILMTVRMRDLNESNNCNSSKN